MLLEGQVDQEDPKNIARKLKPLNIMIYGSETRSEILILFSF